MRLPFAVIFDSYPCRIFFAGALAAVILLQVVLAKPVFNMMLLDAARGPAVHWATHILGELDHWTFAVSEDGVDHTHHHEERQHVIGAFSAGFDTGTILQVDLIRLDCMCAVSIGQGLPKQDNSNAAVPSITAALELMYLGEAPAGRVVGFGDYLVELDAVELDEVIVTGASSISLGPSAEYAAAIFVSQSAGQPDLALRLLMDLTDHRHNLKLLLSLMSIIVTSVSVLIIGTAARAIFRLRRNEVMSEEQARFLAERDSLTGLFNRLGFRNRAKVLLAECKAKGRRACLIQYDVDSLKLVNDMHGHPTGDRLLVDIANKINATYSSSAVIARLGSDEFAVLVEESKLTGGIEALEGCEVDGAARALAVTTSIGFAFYPNDGDSLYQLMKATDLALINSKKSPSSQVTAYHSNMSDAFRKRAWEIQGIREAIATDQLEPYYQPLVDSKTLEVVGFETLVRWNHPELGTMSPGFFQNALDHPETSIAVTRRMMDRMLSDLAGWRAQGYNLSAGLNVGEYDLRQSDFLSSIDSALEKHGVQADALTIEVTESAVNAANLTAVLPILDGLRSRGICVALDDFGTGTSSLTTLRTLPRTTIKIDKSFVEGILREGEDRAIVRALTRIGHDMGIRVVAEGVEDDEQVEMLCEIGVDTFQGFLFGKPMPATEVSQRLKDWSLGQPGTKLLLANGLEQRRPLSRLG